MKSIAVHNNKKITKLISNHKKLRNMETLHLNLEKKWFYAHLKYKKDEYRDITPYWCNRLLLAEDNTSKPPKYWEELMSQYGEKFVEYLEENILERKRYPTITFSNGMKKIDDLPRFIKKYHQLRIGIGKKEWGATSEKSFILKCGKPFNLKNCN